MSGRMRSGNLRDLGGMPLGDGRVIRPGVLYRSGEPATLDEVERRRLTGLRLVVDLRTHEENIGSAEFWADHGRPDILAMPVLSGQRLYPPDEMRRICTDPGHASEYMAQVYADLVEALPKTCLRELVDRIADGQVPVLIHCAAGQDRTGVLVAVLLLGLGVPRETVVADYARSVESWDEQRILGWMRGTLGPDFGPACGPAARQMLAEPHLLETALDRLLTQHRSIEAYFEAADVSTAGLRRARVALSA